MQGVIFDFNGTLFWDSHMHYDAWRIYSEKLRGYPFTDEEMQKYMFGRTNADIIEYATGKKQPNDVVERLAGEKESFYRDMCRKDPENFHLAKGAIEYFEYLKSKNIPMTIATMSERENVEFYIKEFGLAQWFDIDKIVYSDGTIPGKPAPDIFLIAAKNIGVEPQNCVVFEDAISGIESAKRAGIGKIIAVASLESYEYYQKIEGISLIISDFTEVTGVNKFISL